MHAMIENYSKHIDKYNDNNHNNDLLTFVIDIANINSLIRLIWPFVGRPHFSSTMRYGITYLHID